jgi:hypothetical protein
VGKQHKKKQWNQRGSKAPRGGAVFSPLPAASLAVVRRSIELATGGQPPPPLARRISTFFFSLQKSLFSPLLFFLIIRLLPPTSWELASGPQAEFRASRL